MGIKSALATTFDCNLVSKSDLDRRNIVLFLSISFLSSIEYIRSKGYNIFKIHFFHINIVIMEACTHGLYHPTRELCK